MSDFEGKSAVVIGGSGGIGREVAAMLYKNGADLVIHGQNQNKLDKAVDYIKKTAAAGEGRKFNSKVRTVQYTISAENFLNLEKSTLNSFVKEADILCVCYGPFLQSPVHEMTAEQWQEISLLDYALPGTFLSAALGHMIEKKWGRILLFGGTGTSFRGEFKTNAAYAGAKTGVGVLVQSTAACYADLGITCNGILPGFVETEYVDEPLSRSLAEKMPGGTLISKKSVAESAEFLLKNGDLNGVLLKLDRGWSPSVVR